MRILCVYVSVHVSFMCLHVCLCSLDVMCGIMMNTHFAWKCTETSWSISSYFLSTGLNLSIFYLSVGKHVWIWDWVIVISALKFIRGLSFKSVIFFGVFRFLLLHIIGTVYQPLVCNIHLGHMESIKAYLNGDGQNIDHKLNICCPACARRN